MIAPDLCFRFAQPIDTTSGTIQLVYRDESQSLAAATVRVPLFSVPNDRIFIVSAVQVSAVAGAAQSVLAVNLRLDLVPPSANPIELVVVPEQIPTDPASLTTVRLNWSGEVWLPPGAQIEGFASFVGATAANLCAARLFGMSIPRGNVQQS